MIIVCPKPSGCSDFQPHYSPALYRDAAYIYFEAEERVNSREDVEGCSVSRIDMNILLGCSGVTARQP